MTDLIYKNNRGKEIVLTQFPYWINIESLFDYKWSYATKQRRRGNIVAGFSKDIATQDFVLHFLSDTLEKRNTAIDAFNDAIEQDIFDGVKGTLLYGDWYTKCYIIGAKNEKWHYGNPVLKKTFTLVREQETWFREITKRSYDRNSYPIYDIGDRVKSFDFELTGAYETGGYDYNFDYIPDFKSFASLENPSVNDSDFILQLTGEAEQPMVQIGDNIYEFNMTVPTGATLAINSIDKTTTLTTAEGTQVNVFGARNPEYYIFERIPTGVLPIDWNGNWEWAITIFEERSEPRWLTV